jgi:hypothetical protein
MMKQKGPPRAKPKPKRVYLGDDVWETTFENGEVEFEIHYDDEEHAALEADAAKAGLTVDELIKKRILTGGPFFDTEPQFEIDALISEYSRAVQEAGKNLTMFQDVLQKIHSRKTAKLPVPVETVTALVSAQIRHLQELTELTTKIERDGKDYPELLVQARSLLGEIKTTMTVILETGIISA